MWFAVAFNDCTDAGDVIVKGLMEPGEDPYSSRGPGYDHGKCMQDRQDGDKKYTGIDLSPEPPSNVAEGSTTFALSYSDLPLDSDYFVSVRQIPSTGQWVVTNSYL